MRLIAIFICRAGILAFLLQPGPGVLAQVPSGDPNWVLTWSDEFGGTGYDYTKWCRRDWRADVHGNASLSAYRPAGNENLIFTGSTMIQEVKQEDHSVVNILFESEPPELGAHTYNYSAPAWFLSQQKFKYGYFEMRFRLPHLPTGKTNMGAGANFWLWWNGETAKPFYEWETDIVEFVSLPGRPHTITFNEHYVIPDPLHPGDKIGYNYRKPLKTTNLIVELRSKMLIYLSKLRFLLFRSPQSSEFLEVPLNLLIRKNIENIRSRPFSGSPTHWAMRCYVLIENNCSVYYRIQHQNFNHKFVG
jgi:hypothetical protein